MVIIQLTAEQLGSIMQNAVREGIADYSKQESAASKADRWLSIEELSDYLPGKPAVTTLYGKVQRRLLPFRRVGRRLVFLQSEIDQYLNSLRCKTQADFTIEAGQYISSTRNSRR